MERPIALLKIAKPAHYSLSESLKFLNRNTNECLHRVQDGQLIKAFRVNGHNYLVNLLQENDELVINKLYGPEDEHAGTVFQHYFTQVLDLNLDLQPFYELLHKSKSFSYMVRDYAGTRMIGIPDLYECLCWCIIGQQINLSFAYQVKRRLVEKYGDYVTMNGESHFLFPKPAKIAAASIDGLKAMKFSTNKAKYIIGLSELFASGALDQATMSNLSDEEKINQLLGIKGIGVWTANYALMKTFKVRSAILYGDAGLNAALRNHGFNPSTRENVDEVFKPFKGWEGYLVFYLWRSLYKNN